MNIVIIMSGGVGARFGATIPKQYNLIAGKPVIDYVIDAVQESASVDRIVVVMDKQWKGYSERIGEIDCDIVENGQERLISLFNGLKFIHENYACEKVVVVDAVAPFLYGKLVDDYFDKLDNYDAVITSQKITGGFTDVYDSKLDREKYIITQSPEGFKFDLLWNNFDLTFPYQETAGMLPKGSKRFYNFDFKNNLKLTYDFELAYAEYALANLGKIPRKNNIAFFEKSLLYTEGIKSFFLREEPEKTMRWIDGIYAAMPELMARWKIISFLPNQVSRYGLVLQADSGKYGHVIMKFIPEFVNRFERELEAMRLLPSTYMCRLIDYDIDNRVMLLSEVRPAKYASFDENLKLTDMFRHVIKDAVKYDGTIELNYIPEYGDELKEKLSAIDMVPYCKDEVEKELKYAISLYEAEFSKSPRYILHGDLHELNILDDGKRFWGIDPSGMLAPLELECVRFIRNDVRNHPSFGYEARFELLIDSFSKFVDKRRLILMFIIDMAYCTYNSTFENEEQDETMLDLKLVEIAKGLMNCLEKTQ